MGPYLVEAVQIRNKYRRYLHWEGIYYYLNWGSLFFIWDIIDLKGLLFAFNYWYQTTFINLRSQKASKDYDILALEKSDTTRDLQERLDLSQKKLANYMAQTSSKGYTNVKAMHDRYEIDKEKFAQDLCTYQVSDKYELMSWFL